MPVMIVRFEFHGGFNDGNTIVEDDSTPIHDAAARRYLFLTDNGRVGAWFREVVPPVPGSQALRTVRQFKEIDDLRNQLRELQGESRRGLLDKILLLMKNVGAPLFHKYQVTNREIRGEETLIRLDFVSEGSDKLNERDGNQKP